MFQISRRGTDEKILISRDVRDQHPAWVHQQTGTESEADLQSFVDQLVEDAFRAYPGIPDECGITLMNTTTITLRISSARYEDSEDCLTAAGEDVARERDLIGWNLNPRWADDQREEILVDVPAS